MFVGFYEAGVEMIHQVKRTVSTIQVELWDLVLMLLFFCFVVFGGFFNVLCLWGFMRQEWK